MTTTQIRGSTQIIDGTISWAKMASGAIVPTASLVDGANFLKKNGSVTPTADLPMGGFKITNLGTPSAGTDATNKSYVDGLINGFILHYARALGTANVTLSGTQTIDGVALAAGDRVLLKGQTTASQNGLWVVAAGAWTRPTDYAAASTFDKSAYVILDPDGTTYGSTKWYCSNTAAVTIDTTSTTWVQDLSGTAYTAGNGISLAGNAIAVSLDTTPGLQFTSGKLAAKANTTQNLLSVTSNGIGIVNSSSGSNVLITNSSNAPGWSPLSGDVALDGNTGIVTVNHTSGSGFLKYGDYVDNETPTGSINGSNTAFTLANTPANSSLSLYLNGMLMEPGSGNDYTISGAAITMLFAPATGDKLRAYYRK